jgi:hypothetical protein
MALPTRILDQALAKDGRNPALDDEAAVAVCRAD